MDVRLDIAPAPVADLLRLERELSVSSAVAQVLVRRGLADPAAARAFLAAEDRHDPSQGVSKAEFDEMVRDLHADDVATATAEPEEDLSRDLLPEDLVLKDDPKKNKGPRRSRNRRHGRR